MLLPGFGAEKQQLLAKSSVLVIGAGGLGCPVLMYLTAAGVGTIGIVDGDVVEMSNLHRQVLFSESDLGKSKAVVAGEKLQKQNSKVNFRIFNQRILPENAVKIIESFDLVVDGSDNFPTRYLVNDACVLLDKPLVYGSIYRFEGQVAVFNLADDNGMKTNYRDLFPESPDSDQIPNCAEAGVLGILPGLIGSLQANEALKILTGLGNPLINQILTYNMLNNSTYIMDLYPNSKSGILMPKNQEELRVTDYDVQCGIFQIENIPAEELESFLESGMNIRLLDVREEFEMPKMDQSSVISIPLGELKERVGELENDVPILVFCQSGKRSLLAASIISEREPNLKIYNLQGGINQWISFQDQLK